MPAIKFHTRHGRMAEIGKRISRGAWERMNRAYDIHKALDSEGREKMQACAWNEKGTPTAVRLCTTLVRKGETPLANRKRSMTDRFMSNTRFERFKGTPIGESK